MAVAPDKKRDEELNKWLDQRARGELARWLEGSARAGALIATTRAVLRVLPVIGADLANPSASDERFMTLLLSWRAISVAFIAGTGPLTKKLYDTAQSTGRALSDALSAVGDHRLQAIRFASQAAGYAAYAVRSESRKKFEREAFSSISAATAANAFEVNPDRGREYYWEQLAGDFRAVDTGTSSLGLAQQSLWQQGASDTQPTRNWDYLKATLLSRTGENWGVWIDWYEARLRGDDINLELELARVLEPSEVDWRTPRVANAKIQAIVERFEEPASSEKTNSNSGPELSTEDRAIIELGLGRDASVEQLSASANKLARIRATRYFPQILSCLDRIASGKNSVRYSLKSIFLMTRAAHYILVSAVQRGAQPPIPFIVAKRAEEVFGRLEKNDRVQNDRPGNPSKGILGPLRNAQSQLGEGFKQSVFLAPKPGDVQLHNVPLHYDAATDHDELGREPFVEMLLQRLETQRESGTVLDGYAVHLHAPWGAGKTSILKMMKRMLTTDRDVADRWTVVEYNAWDNSRRNPPWWAFIETVRKTCFESLEHNQDWGRYRWLLFCWIGWELKTRLYPILIGVLTFGLLILLLWKGNVWLPGGAGGEGWKAGTLLITAIGGIIAALRNSFFGSEKNAKFYEDLSTDPLKAVREFFRMLVKATGQPVIIFIDDLDRCREQYVVDLLEGIQTAFRHENVTYLVAADRKWIKTSFEHHYDIFTDADSRQKSDQPLGYLFLEKLFQISLSVPGMEANARETYWKSLIGDTAGQSTPRDESAEEPKAGSTGSGDDANETVGAAIPTRNDRDLSRQVREEGEKIKDRYGDDITRANVDEYIDDLKRDNVSRVQWLALGSALGKSQSADAEGESRLRGYHKYCPSNPRLMKRMANAYAMRQATTVMEGSQLPTGVLVRWTILEQRYPALADLLAENPERAALFAAETPEKSEAPEETDETTAADRPTETKEQSDAGAPDKIEAELADYVKNDIVLEIMKTDPEIEGDEGLSVEYVRDLTLGMRG
jgi:hypothetical protein